MVQAYRNGVDTSFFIPLHVITLINPFVDQLSVGLKAILRITGDEDVQNSAGISDRRVQLQVNDKRLIVIVWGSANNSFYIIQIAFQWGAILFKNDYLPILAALWNDGNSREGGEEAMPLTQKQGG